MSTYESTAQSESGMYQSKRLQKNKYWLTDVENISAHKQKCLNEFIIIIDQSPGYIMNYKPLYH